MKALVCRDYGDPTQLIYDEIPSPQLRANEVRIAVHAVGLNYADSLQVAGRNPSLTPPFSPVYECSGIVIECGEGVDEYRVGERVLAIMASGAYAEEVVVPLEHVTRLPVSMGMEVAAAFPVAYLTAYLALVQRGQLREGETVVVSGATGNVGSAAVEIAHRLGAKVIAVTGRPELLTVQPMSVLQPRQENLAEKLLELAGEQDLDLVFDTVGGSFFDAAWSGLAWEGRYLVVGFASGQVPQLALFQALRKNGALVGFELGGYITRRHSAIQQAFKTLLSWYQEGSLAPRPPRVATLEEGGRMLQGIVTHQIQEKVVLKVRDE